MTYPVPIEWDFTGNAIPELWARHAAKRVETEAKWMRLREKMMPYSKGEGWRRNLNRFVEGLNREHSRKLHPERYYE